MSLDDGIFNCQTLTAIRSYYVAAGPGVALTWEERLVNLELSWIRQQNSTLVSGLFKICASKECYKLAKEHLYVVEQLHFCHLLVNIYNCLSGDKFSCKLGVPTPLLEDYLQL
ncbi:LOW QUALITY PROTEIN: hypothetical protein ACHAXN_000719 [Cyclotella atomus]